MSILKITESCNEPRSALSVANFIRRRIIERRYPVGGRLPSQRELANELGVSFVTIQRGIDVLRRDGFVDTRGACGTFVVDHPPHLSRIGLVFYDSPEKYHWSRFFRAMLDCTDQPLGSTRIVTYHNVTSASDCESALSLIGDLSAQRIGGLVFATPPHTLAGSPIMEAPGIHRVSISSRVADRDFPSVYPDRKSFFERAIGYLVENGRRRPAIIWADTCSGAPFDENTRLEIGYARALASQAGMKIEPWWLQGTSVNAPGWTQNCVRALFHPRQFECPDSLIIADDNLVEHATSGLIASGLVPPRDVLVVGYANFPRPPRPATAATLIGFDIRRLLATCIQRIGSQRTGDQTPAETLLPAILESELPN